MTLEVKHPFTDPKPDGGDTTIVRPSDWNDIHSIIMSPGVIGRTTVGDGAASVLPLGSGATGNVVLSSQIRERLASIRQIYVRVDLGDVTLSGTSPCEAVTGAHTLQAGDPVVFTCPYDMGDDDNTGTACVTFNATTDVLTFNNNGYANGDPIKLYTSGLLPTGLTPDTRYFVINVSGANDFQVSLTSGGAAVTFSGSATGLCRARRDSELPTGVVEGKPYFVIATGLSSTVFQFSETLGGSAVNASGAQLGRARFATGNDANDGSAATRSGAVLSPNRAADLFHELDLNNIGIVVQLADGLYLPDATGVYAGSILYIEGENPSPGLPRRSMAVGTGHFYFYGNEVSRNQVRLSDAVGAFDYFPIVQVGGVPYTFNIRKMAFVAGTKQGSPLKFNGFGPLSYAEHMSYWGNITGYCYEYAGYALGYQHGMTEIFGDMYGLVAAFGGGKCFYLSFGQDYYGGVISFFPQTDHWVVSAGSGGDVSINAVIKFEGDWSGTTPWVLAPDGKLGHTRYDAYWGDQLPGGQPPQTRAGAIYTYRDSNLPTGVGQYFAHAHYTHLLQRPSTVALLPTAAEGRIVGSRCMVNDATATTFASVVAGSGSNVVPVYFDGTDWRIG